MPILFYVLSVKKMLLYQQALMTPLLLVPRSITAVTNIQFYTPIYLLDIVYI